MRKLALLLAVFALAACSNDKHTEAETEAVSGVVKNVVETPAEEAEGPAYFVNEYTSQVFPVEEELDPAVLLTFDDAPDGYALDIAETLKDKNASAIFFVNGMYLENEEGRNALKQLHDMGFVIGNHTHTHASMDTVNREQTEYEIRETNRLVEEIIGEKPRFFRAPFGINTNDSIEIAEDEGMIVMNWTYGYDWEAEYQDKDALADIMVHTEFLSDGANLLMHDREWTSAALPDIIDGIREEGYNFINPKNIEYGEVDF